jgi:thiol-disulfide isomerase/thioredoxin
MRQAVICLLLCLATTGWATAARAAHERPNRDKYAFDLVDVVTDIEMSKAKMTEDQPLVLFVWAPDCPACIRHMPYASALYVKLDQYAASFVSICITQEKADALAFVDEKGLEFPVLWSGSGTYGNGFEYDGWPATYVFRQGGKLEGMVDKSGPDYITEVLEMVDAAKKE